MSDSASAQNENPETCLLDGAGLQPVGGNADSKLDDSDVSELSARFADSLGLPADRRTPESTLEGKTDDQAKKEFNDAMEVISRFAEDVVKTWFARMYNRELKELFPDGLIGHTASIRMMPGEDLLRERKRARVARDEETRGDDTADAQDALGWELKLAVVGPDHRVNLDEWKRNEPAVLGQMQGLLKTAWGYIQYALESYNLPTPELFKNSVIPSPWGTLYVLGAPEESPQIGVSIERPKLDVEKKH
jgi:hypothetical protein